MRLKRRALQQNDRGDEVVRLQQALEALGYDVGPIDGEFGYMTQDALRQFQREHRLRIDGKAGPGVRAMLYRPELTAMRRIHVTRAQERLVDVAKEHGVTIDYLRRANRLPPRRLLYEGQRLFIRGRFVIGALRVLIEPREVEFTLRRVGRNVSALGGLQFKLQADGSIQGEWNPEVVAACLEQKVMPLAVVHTWDMAGQSDDALGSILRSRSHRAQAIKRMVQLAGAKGVGGLVLDLGGLRFGDGNRFVRFIAEVAQRTRRNGTQLYVSVPVVRPGIKGAFESADLDWIRLQTMVDGLILQAHRRTAWGHGVLTAAQLEHSVKAICRRLPPWKVLLGVSLGAREYSEGARETRDVSYQRAMAMGYMRGLRPAWDEQHGLLTASYIAAEAEGEKRTLWIESARSLEQKFAWVERYNMKGLFLWPLGDEDSRVWQVVPQWIKAWRHEAGDTGI